MENFIRRYQISEKKACKDVIKWFEKNKELHSEGCMWLNGEVKVDKEYKESMDIALTMEAAYKHSELAIVLDFLWDCVTKYIQEFDYIDTFKFAHTEPLNIQKYNPPGGGYKKWHCERGAPSNRMLVWMLYLNTVNDKGGTEFKYLKHTEDATEGKLIIWPTDFTHLHRGVVSPTEEKYVMTGWYSFID